MLLLLLRYVHIMAQILRIQNSFKVQFENKKAKTRVLASTIC